MGTNGRTSGELTEEEIQANIDAMGRAIVASADEIMMKVFRETGMLFGTVDSRTRLKVGDCVSMGDDGQLCAATCEDRVPIGVVIAKDGANAVVRQGACVLEFKIGSGLALDDLPDYEPALVPSKAAEAMTYSNLLAPMKPLTADSIMEAMKSMDAIKARDAETKKRYDDIVMSGFTAPHPLSLPAVIPYVDRPPMRATIPDYGASGYRYQPVLDDRPWSHAPTKPIPKSEKEIYQLQKLNDGDRKRVELFPVIREAAARTQSQSIAAGLGIWSTRGDAKLPPEPKPYPHVSDEDLLKDA